MRLLPTKKANSSVVPRRRITDVAPSDHAQEDASSGGINQQYAYRRNRTLTGSLSSDVSSANEYNAELRSSRVHGHHLRRNQRRLALVLSAVACVTFCLGMLLYQVIGIPSIVSAKLISEPIETPVYRELVSKYLRTHPSEQFRFSIGADRLAAYMQENGAPEVASIDNKFEFSSFGSSQVKILFREPAVVWETSNTRMYVDRDGNMFARNYYAEPSVRVRDDSGVSADGNQVVVSNKFLVFMGKIIGRMHDNGMEVSELNLPAGTARQVEVHIKGVAYPVKMSIDRSAGEQAEDAARSIRFMAAQGTSPTYLDVRVSGRAYYKTS